jgi:hypothetical protein
MEHISLLHSIVELEEKDIRPQVHFVVSLQKALRFVSTTRQLLHFPVICKIVRDTPLDVSCGPNGWAQEVALSARHFFAAKGLGLLASSANYAILQETL